MDVLDLLRVMARRWWIVVPCIAASTWLAVRVGQGIAPEYSTSASFLLTGTVAADDDGRGTTVTSGGVVAELLQSRPVREAVLGSGGTAPYRVEADGQLVRVIAQGSELDALVPTVDAVLAAVQGEVGRREDALAVPPAARTLVQTLRQPGQPQPAAPGTSSNGGFSEPGGSGRETTGDYAAVGSVLLVRAQDVSPRNPVSASQSQATLLAEILRGQRSQAAVAREGGVGSYQLEADDRQPLLRVRVTGGDEARVLQTVDALLTVLNGELTARQEQAGVPPELRVSASPLVLPEGAARDSGSPSRAGLGVLALGVVVAATLAVVVDRVVSAEGSSGVGAARASRSGPHRRAEDPVDLRTDYLPSELGGRRRP